MAPIQVEESSEPIACFPGTDYATTKQEVCIPMDGGCRWATTACHEIAAAYCVHEGRALCYQEPERCIEVSAALERHGEGSPCYILRGPVAAAPVAINSTQPVPAQPSATPPSATSPTAAPTPAPRLLIFGGSGHKKFLGCLCSEIDSDSVLNQYGQYGNPYNMDSIWNHYGDYGSRYGTNSACNAYAIEPPVVVMPDGTFVGYLTANKYMSGALVDPDLFDWLTKKVCDL